MATFQMQERCSDCGEQLSFLTAKAPPNDHGEPAISCPGCLDLKRTGSPEPEAGDVITFIYQGGLAGGSVEKVYTTGTVRVRGRGTTKIKRDQIIEIIPDPGGKSVESEQ